MSAELIVEDPPFEPFETTGSPVQPVPTGSKETPLEAVRKWFETYVCTVTDGDLDILTLWAAHTHLVSAFYTTPRIVIDSPTHGAGKTTTLEHLERLCLAPVQAASLSSPALLPRMLDKTMRTVLIDEADRSLDPKRDGVQELLAVINSGYKRGATRPVLIPTKEGWDTAEMPTFCPVVMAGNNPNLPEDTRSRCIRVLLLPDLEGRVEETDWEEIEPEAQDLAEALALWAENVHDFVRTSRPEMPDGCRGRTKERWAPLRRVAEAAGGRWPAAADELIRRDLEEQAADREDGMVTTPPAVALLRDLALVWQDGDHFTPTQMLTERLVFHAPEFWGPESNYGRALTVQRMGRMLAQGYKVHSDRPGGVGARGYLYTTLEPAWRRMRITPPAGTGGSRLNRRTGGDS